MDKQFVLFAWQIALMGKVLSASSILICAYISVDNKNYNNHQILIVGLYKYYSKMHTFDLSIGI